MAHLINPAEQDWPFAGSNKTPEEAIKQLNSEYQIYKSVESQLLHKKTRLMTKVPDLHRALDMVLLLIEKQGQEVIPSLPNHRAEGASTASEQSRFWTMLTMDTLRLAASGIV